MLSKSVSEINSGLGGQIAAKGHLAKVKNG